MLEINKKRTFDWSDCFMLSLYLGVLFGGPSTNTIPLRVFQYAIAADFSAESDIDSNYVCMVSSS